MAATAHAEAALPAPESEELVPLRCPACGRCIGLRGESNLGLIVLRCRKCKQQVRFEDDRCCPVQTLRY
ncbi:MAG: hypothetical protein V3S71_08055 [Acidobacteriota bacterium]